ncbi:MAG: hypothetical protein FJX20_16250 [Alphaproteobacteria bacterium]|nr:hypothetical protein [Alphaproteobacteria bacterium]
MGSGARLAGLLAAGGGFLSVIAVSAVGFQEFRAWNQCKAAWQHAGERTGDRLTDRAATPYLGMMLASKHQVPSDYIVARSDFISACRAGAIRRVATRDEAGNYREAVPISAVRQTVPATAN